MLLFTQQNHDIKGNCHEEVISVSVCFLPMSHASCDGVNSRYPLGMHKGKLLMETLCAV